MSVCIRCKTKIGLFSFRSYSKETKRCNKCDGEIQWAVHRFIDSFRRFAADGVLTRAEWNELQEMAARDNLDLDEALYYAYPDVIELIRRGIEIATKDNVISQHEEKYFDFVFKVLSVPEQLEQEVRATISEYRAAQEVRNGNLPNVQPTLGLPEREICHLELNASYINTDTKTYVQRDGKFLATNRRLIFSSPQRELEVDWRRVTNVVRKAETIYLEMSIKRGNGLYIFNQPVLAEAIINKLVELNRKEANKHAPGNQREEKDQQNTATTPLQKKSKSAYEILNLVPGADRETIRSAYREMVKLYHPDKVASLAPEFQELAELRMKEINVAYHALTQ